MKTVSIVIPCRNEESYIAKCLDSILVQTYPQDAITVYVCDGNSSDATQKIIRDFVLKNSNIHLLVNEKQTTQFALNLGIKQSISDVIIILGAHAELYPDYVSNCMKTFTLDSDIGCVGGLIENVNENATSEVIGAAMSSSFGVGNAHFRTGNAEGFVDTVAFGAYRKEVFEKIGYFDEELIRNQDDEFNFRVIKGGFKIFLSKSIRSKYYVRASFKKLFQQYRQYGYWKVYVNKKHKTITSIRQLVPLLFVLYLMIGAISSVINSYLLIVYLSGILFYFFSSFYVAMRLSSKFARAFTIMLSFFILHFSYGLGYLNGIFDFFILQKRIKKDELLTR